MTKPDENFCRTISLHSADTYELFSVVTSNLFLHYITISEKFLDET